MKLQYLKGVTDLILDRDLCNGCGMCINVCPHNVFGMENKKAAIIDQDACMACGACKLNCPVSAISVSSGVGCAYAVYFSALTKKPPACGPSGAEAACGQNSAEAGCDPPENGTAACCGSSGADNTGGSAASGDV
jgi:NAD-dependent dihydropyrimidine dehydrogenase PreA subunit